MPETLFSSPERTRTSNLAVNSRPLCRLSYQGMQNPIIWNIIGSVKQNRPDLGFPGHFLLLISLVHFIAPNYNWDISILLLRDIINLLLQFNGCVLRFYQNEVKLSKLNLLT